MSSKLRAWMVAGTVGLVEALKDQGFARSSGPSTTMPGLISGQSPRQRSCLLRRPWLQAEALNNRRSH
ncbi:hypothetical protein L1987_41779 [Smallanthus sonchifolius]|uniref:Uncharacterized protein n=1 Tax=Smallanthus sonchifolius TaxID=185202 RepID=A0ACB9GUR2_9ASTR|nr:hypothetical protein L1987_41779 [Smallanthus sonchifolius]